MPVLIEAAADIVLIAGIIVLIGMLLAVQHTFVPMLEAIGSFDTHIPGIGRPFKGITNRAVNAINNGIGAALTVTSHTLAALIQGITWSIEQTGVALSKFAQDTEIALGYLRDTTIPKLITAAIHSAENAAFDALHAASGAERSAAQALSDAKVYVGQRFVKLEGEIDDALATAKAYAAANIIAVSNAILNQAGQLVHDVDIRLGKRIDKLEGSVENKLAAVAATAERVARAALGDVLGDAIAAGGVIDRAIHRAITEAMAKAVAGGAATEVAISHAIDAALREAVSASGVIETRIQADIARAIGSVVSVGGVTLPQVQDLINRAVAAVAHTGSVVLPDIAGMVRDAVDHAIAGGGFIGQIVDDVRRQIEGELANLDTGDVAAVGAATAALAATLSLTLAETGLDRAECRTKVKGICGVNPSDWAGALAGISVFALAIDLEEVVSIGQEMIGDLAAIGDDLGGIL